MIDAMHQFQHTITLAPRADDALYLAVRAGFVAKGTTLNRWCIDNGVNRQTAEKALKGERHSNRARSLLNTILDAALGREAPIDG